MKMTPWFPPDTVPVRRGFYQRDHRQVREYGRAADRRISLDLWQPVDDPHDSLYPGVWYVQEPGYWWRNPDSGRMVWLDGLNDASQQRLPWRGLDGSA